MLVAYLAIFPDTFLTNLIVLDYQGTNVVESIVLDSLIQKEELNAEAFLDMKRLRLLKICNVLLPHGLDYLSNELLVIEWHEYPLKSLPRSFQPKNLVELIMRCSHIKQLSKGFISVRFLSLLVFLYFILTLSSELLNSIFTDSFPTEFIQVKTHRP